jgi:hypothetical protein
LTFSDFPSFCSIYITKYHLLISNSCNFKFYLIFHSILKWFVDDRPVFKLMSRLSQSALARWAFTCVSSCFWCQLLVSPGRWRSVCRSILCPRYECRFHVTCDDNDKIFDIGSITFAVLLSFLAKFLYQKIKLKISFVKLKYLHWKKNLFLSRFIKPGNFHNFKFHEFGFIEQNWSEKLLF